MHGLNEKNLLKNYHCDFFFFSEDNGDLPLRETSGSPLHSASGPQRHSDSGRAITISF